MIIDYSVLQGGYTVYVGSVNPNGPSTEDFIEYAFTDEPRRL